MTIESARWARSLVHRTLAAALCCLMLPGVARAQTPEQQVVNDAATALGGRDKILAVKTLLLEGGGSTVAGTSLRWDELAYASAINQLRDVRRAYDLANGRARFEFCSQLSTVPISSFRSSTLSTFGTTTPVQRDATIA